MVDVLSNSEFSRRFVNRLCRLTIGRRIARRRLIGLFGRFRAGCPSVIESFAAPITDFSLTRRLIGLAGCVFGRPCRGDRRTDVGH